MVKSVSQNVRTSNVAINEGKSATSFCCQVAAWFPDMFGIYMKTHNMAKNSTTTKTRQKIITYLEFLEF
jgi:hypothetical protein